MGIDKGSVALIDSDGDALSATPAGEGRGASTTPRACVSITQGASFAGGAVVSNSGRTQSVMVPLGQERTTLARLGDRLCGHDPDEATVVTTTRELYAKLVTAGVDSEAALTLVAEMTSASYADRSTPFVPDDFKHLAAELQ